jgi:hypothetical protein
MDRFDSDPRVQILKPTLLHAIRGWFFLLFFAEARDENRAFAKQRISIPELSSLVLSGFIDNSHKQPRRGLIQASP